MLLLPASPQDSSFASSLLALALAGSQTQDNSETIFEVDPKYLSVAVFRPDCVGGVGLMSACASTVGRRLDGGRGEL